MCGIVGIVGHSPVQQALHDALTVLQHRGQDAAGIVTYDGDQLYLRKANGLVRDVFSKENMQKLQGQIGIAHVRYPTAGSDSAAEAQPFYVNSPFGISFAHNGNLTNAKPLKSALFQTDRRHINTQSDSEILLNVLAHELAEIPNYRLKPDDFFTAVKMVHKRCKGAYAAVALINGHGLLAFRDPHGIRPLVLGRRAHKNGYEYMVASESVALDILDFERVRDVAPGEAIYIPFAERTLHHAQCAEKSELTPCLFEHVYLARPDSVLDDVSVYKARLRMGETLANHILETWSDHDIDVVIPVPDTSTTAAIPLAYRLNRKMRLGFVKNRYVGRTFIMPEQSERKKSVKRKLNAIDLEFEGKHVLIVDDSIVRGTTSQQIVQMAREAGAKKVTFASMAPPVRHPNVYGIDMPSASELIAHGRTEDEICALIGADKIIYQTLPDLIEAVRGTMDIERFDTSVFDGQYVTGDVDAEYLKSLDEQRNDDAKKTGGSTPQHIDLHNDPSV